jgi:hypothetical protein
LLGAALLSAKKKVLEHIKKIQKDTSGVDV